jgi:hypothetical protein
MIRNITIIEGPENWTWAEQGVCRKTAAALMEVIKADSVKLAATRGVVVDHVTWNTATPAGRMVALSFGE